MAAVGIPAAGLRELIAPAMQLERLYKNSPVFERLKAVLCSNNVARIALAYSDPCIVAVSRAFEALRKLGILPLRIPALPENIQEILNEKCPIRGHEANPDGTPLRVWQTHSLYLIPPGTVNELEERVSAYGKNHLAEYGGTNPLRFRAFWPKARQEHVNTEHNELQWILMSNDVLPESGNKPYAKQEQMVKELSAKALTTYEVPSLKEAAAFAFLHKIATRESVLQAGNEQNEDRCTSTRVKEITEGVHLVVGDFAPSGVIVHSSFSYTDKNQGILASVKF